MTPAAAPSGFGRPEWLVIAVTVAARAGAVFLAARTSMPWLDPDGYLVHAAALASGQGTWLEGLTDEGGLIRPPLYALALSAALRLGAAPWMTLLAQALLAGGACAAVMSLARSVGSPRSALWAGWCFALSAGAVSAAPAFWSEHLYVPLASIALALLIRAVRSPGPARFALAGVAFGAAVLTRSMPLYVVPVLALVIIAREPEARRGALVMLLVFGAIAGAYITTASRSAGRLVLVENTVQWLWQMRSTPETPSAVYVSSVVPAMLREARSSPGLFVRESLSHVRATFRPSVWHVGTDLQFPQAALALFRIGAVVLLLGMLLLAPPGVAAARDRTAAFVLATWVLVQIPLIALSASNAGPRYRAPLDPALLALAAAAITRL